MNPVKAIRFLWLLCVFTSANAGLHPVLPPDPFPHFSHAAGFYDDPITLTLSSDDPDATILYTLDGSDPDPANISGKRYTFKNEYPYQTGGLAGPSLTGEIRTFAYTSPLQIENRSFEPDQLTTISSTFYPNDYSPKTPVQKATVVKARVVLNDIAGPVVVHTYFIGMPASSQLPVISISVDEDVLFGYENGIYVPGKDFDDWRAANPFERTDGFTPSNYQRDEEHPAWLEIFDLGQCVVVQKVGIKMAGSVSLYYPQKSIRLFARSEYGRSTIPYRFFPELPFEEYKRITLRNSGNDNRVTMFRDAAIQESVKHLHFGTQAYRPAVLFLNGEYWGIHNMRQHLDKNYLHDMYGVDDDNIDVLELPEIQEGDRQHYDRLFAFLQENTLAESANFAFVETQVDIENFTDYQIAQIFSSNTDWPGRNARFWRARTEQFVPDAGAADGRWRWLMKDTDFGFGLTTTASHNTLVFATKADGVDMPNPWWSTLLLRRLLENAKYRNNFINRFADLLNSTFLPERLGSVIQGLKSGIEPEMPRHIARWNAPQSPGEWASNVQAMVNFVNNRPEQQRQHIKSFFGTDGTKKLRVDVSRPEGGYVRVNTIDILPSTIGVAPEPYPWTGVYFGGVPVTLMAYEYPGYHFVRWIGADVEASNEVTITLGDDKSLTALFVPESDGVWRYSPVHGENEVRPDAGFQWITSPADLFDLQVSTTSDFSTTVIDKGNIAGLRYIPEESLQYDTEYFWRMRPAGSGTWSEVWSFQTAPMIPVGTEQDARFAIFPNPADRVVSIRLTPSLRTEVVEIRDLTGRLLDRIKTWNDDLIQLDVRHYPRGMYLLLGKNRDGRTFVKRLFLK